MTCDQSLAGRGGDQKEGWVEHLYCSSITSPVSSSSLLLPILAILQSFIPQAFPEPLVGSELTLLPWLCRTLGRSLMPLLCSLGLELIMDKSFLLLEIITKFHFGLASSLHTIGAQWMGC